MARFATGVTVLTVQTGDGETVAMTANALTSVSLDPLLMLVCVGKQASIAPHILTADSFAFSFLNEDQEDLSSYFAGIWSEQTAPPSFTFLEWEDNVLLEGSIAGIACDTDRIIEGGDHWIVIGRATALYHPPHPGKPLVFYNGLYRQLEDLEDEYGQD
jgi:flavin reductase (DIM6/NTAB) family NADH-FMN oxidoreductase RutF